MNSFKILFILTLAFVAFSVETDVYVASFPDMVRALSVSETSIQKILSLNFLGICLSCLFSGPLSDSFGRKRVLSFGTGLFALASLACYFSLQFETILLGRFFQGLGAGTILAVVGSCVFDLYNPVQSGQLIAILNGVVTVAMSFAPVVGVWLNTYYGWRSNFLFILILATASWIGIVFFLPETLSQEKRQPFQIKVVVNNYFELLKNKNFTFGSLIWSLMITCLIVYTANVSLLFVEHLKIPATSFGFYQGVTMGSFGFFSLVCSYLIRRFGDRIVKRYGTYLFFAGILSLVLVNLFFAESPLLISLAMAVVAAGTAPAIVVYFTDSMVGVLNSGAALSLVQGLRLFLACEMTDLSRVIFDGSLGSVLAVLFGMAILAFLLILFLPKPQASSKSTESNPVHAMI